MTSSRSIVITSINAPTPAVASFAGQADWELVVVGDKKTPADWSLDGVRFLSWDDPRTSGLQTARLLPFNSYARKMLGYLHAIEQGATTIVDTDDDNAPLEGWSWPDWSGTFQATPRDRGFVNVYRSFTDMDIWPRGLPLPRVTDPASVLSREELHRSNLTIGVWQGLADGDPDVDAIYRLTRGLPCTFDDGEPVVLATGTVCPFNSQNTAFRPETYALLYLPAHVSFRFTDILRGLVAQPVLWAAGYSLGFTKATVFQDRNEHDYMADFASEIPCYLHVEEVVRIATATVRPGAVVEDNLVAVYRALVHAGIVPEQELALLEAWLTDLQSIRG